MPALWLSSWCKCCIASSKVTKAFWLRILNKIMWWTLWALYSICFCLKLQSSEHCVRRMHYKLFYKCFFTCKITLCYIWVIMFQSSFLSILKTVATCLKIVIYWFIKLNWKQNFISLPFILMNICFFLVKQYTLAVTEYDISYQLLIMD